jgi:hypothetical protein
MLMVMVKHLPPLGQGLGNAVDLAGDVGGSSLLSHGAPWGFKIRHYARLNLTSVWSAIACCFDLSEQSQVNFPQSHTNFQKSAIHAQSFSDY